MEFYTIPSFQEGGGGGGVKPGHVFPVGKSGGVSSARCFINTFDIAMLTNIEWTLFRHCGLSFLFTSFTSSTSQC